MPINHKPKILVICGPTASGKSGLAVKIAKKYRGEIISADSRQVYKGLTIGTGKITKKEMEGVPHHLLDVVDPKKRFTVEEFKKLAQDKIAEILERGNLPILCGGTGFYIEAVVDNVVLPDVPPNPALRKKLANKSAAELFLMLKKLDPKRAKNIDAQNPHRLVRAIEIAKAIGTVPKIQKSQNYQPLFIGLSPEELTLRKNIRHRLLLRIEQGMIAEAKQLHAKGLSWKRMNELGLEYRYLALHLQGKMSRAEMIEKLNSEIWHYAKRQMTWFKKESRIQWFEPTQTEKIHGSIKKFQNLNS